jgi:hypothetical protein
MEISSTSIVNATSGYTMAVGVRAGEERRRGRGEGRRGEEERERGGEGRRGGEEGRGEEMV